MSIVHRLAPLAVVAGLIFAGSPASAQPEKTTTSTAAAKPDAAKSGEKKQPGEELFQPALKLEGLTDEQKSKIEKLQTGYAKQLKKIRTDARKAASGDKKQAAQTVRSKQGELNKKTRTQIEKLLTDEQKKEFAKTQKKGDAKGKQARAGRAAKAGKAAKEAKGTGTADAVTSPTAN